MCVINRISHFKIKCITDVLIYNMQFYKIFEHFLRNLFQVLKQCQDSLIHSDGSVRAVAPKFMELHREVHI